MDNRRFFRQAMMLTLAAGLLASCSKDNAGVPEPDDLIEIVPGATYSRVDGTTPGESLTGPLDNSNLEDMTFAFARGDQSHPVLPQYSYSAEHIVATYKELEEEGKARLQLSPAQYYSVSGTKTEMQGWYPPIAHTLVSGGYPMVTFTIDGSQDVMVSNVLEGTINDLGIDGPNLFVFEHMLTQFQLQVTAESEIAAQQWGKVTAINLLGESDSYMYALLYSPAGIFSGSASLSVHLPQEEVVIASGATTPAGKIMVKPRSISWNEDVKFEITTTNGKKEVSLYEQFQGTELEGTKFEAGKAYLITLNFLQGEITIKLTPAEWEAAEGLENVDLAENQPYVISDKNYIVSRNMFGDAEGWTVRDEKWTTTPTSESETSVPVILEVETSNLTEDATLDHVGCPEGWRIPTKTELELIAKYKDKLTKEFTGGDGSSEPLAIKGTYWSGTEDASGARYYVDMETGESGTATKEDNETHHVRCVRDVEM